MSMQQATVLWVRLELLSDTTFGRGDGVAGLVDDEVQHDRYGLPYLGGKTLKGLLCAECAEIIFALEQGAAPSLPRWQAAAQFLFGRAGSTDAEAAQMAVGDARLPADLRGALMREYAQADDSRRRRLRLANLEALTTIRRQTAMDAVSGAPKRNTLRSMRVILRTTAFDAPLTFAPVLTTEPADSPAAELTASVQGLLAACCRSLRRGGTGRNRGRGRLQVELYDRDPSTGAEPVTAAWFNAFAEVVQA